MRLGLFGGTFDPVHLGHLLLAETCRECCRLDQVWFLPAAVPPHKQRRQLAPAKDRIAMLQLAIAGQESLQVSALEIERGGVSYTFQTLQAVQQRKPEAVLFFLMGSDSLHDLPTWREPQRICEMALPVVVRRGGTPPPDLQLLAPFLTSQRLEMVKSLQVDMPQVELSSSWIRAAVAAGRSIRFRTPRAVEKYIQTHGLYRSEPETKFDDSL